MPSFSIPTIHTVTLTVACFFGTTVYAFCLLFATVIMPGLDSLEDADYLQAFQVIDGRIQNNEPWFVLSWMISMVAPIFLAILTLRLETMLPRRRAVLIFSCLLFLVGHIITMAKNIPINNRLHGTDLDQTSDDTLASMRQDFVNSWCPWNTARTWIFGLCSLFWLAVLLCTDSPEEFKKRASFDSPPEVESRFNQVV